MERHEIYHLAFKEPDDRPIYEIAAQKYYLHGISKPGLFDWINESRHYIGPLDALIDDRTREVNILKPVRGGGSVVGDLFLQWALDNDPGNYMQVLQTDDEVSTYVSGRTIKNLERSLPGLLPRIFPRGEGEIELKNGAVLYLSGPGISNMQTKLVRYMHLDELHVYKKGILNEAQARLGDCKRLHISKLLCISQGGPPVGKSLEEHDWYDHFKQGEPNEWEVSCMDCGKRYQPKFAGVRDDGSFWGLNYDSIKTPNGDYDVRKCLDSIHFRCPHCPGVFIDGPKIKNHWNRTGDYLVIGDPYPAKRSFHWEAVIMDNWRDLVELWLNACNAANRGNYLPKIQFYQKYRAMFMDEALIMRQDRRFGRLVVETQSDWPDEYARFMSIDKQMEDVYWYLICAWSKDGRVRRLSFGRAYGVAELDEISKTFKVPTFLSTGGKHSHIYIDSKFEPKGDLGVYQACCTYGWVAVKGEQPESGGFIHPGPKQTKIMRSYSPVTYGDPHRGKTGEGKMKSAIVIRFVKSTMNSRVQGLIDRGRIEHATALSPEMEAEYNDQMSSRRRVSEWKDGKTRVSWWEGKNDHVRDCWNIQCVPATIAGILPDTLDAMEVKREPFQDAT